MLTSEEVKKDFKYSDGKLYKFIRHSLTPHYREIKALDSKGYIQVFYKNKVYRGHRIIFLLVHGYLPKIIDHVNGDRLDNRIENLRPANECRNSQNARMSKNNTSGIKGVYFDQDRQKWSAEIGANNKRHRLGRFSTKFDAACAAYSARNKLHGEFCRHT
jgi:hypothetical protein